MKKVSGMLDGVLIELEVAQTLNQYKEGVRLSGGTLHFNAGMLFDFGAPMQILLENSGVDQDLQVLYFSKFKKYGVVEETSTLKAQDPKAVASKGFYPIAIELRKDFCEQHRIGKGSTLILKV
jgi:uncharacterized membrane protein (UPF0127 family)